MVGYMVTTSSSYSYAEDSGSSFTASSVHRLMTSFSMEKDKCNESVSPEKEGTAECAFKSRGCTGLAQKDWIAAEPISNPSASTGP
ncbi:hypothetical protein Baya_4849 [Bagarius yarrelli]|uniref:Uncharacterized protein n=1 Tax=Bagarius yarrelli TaxID=175774 RepID=A0A556TRR0_BAGYA|nr:hypothetical protein Baya_4849 [Bagarius yarrelli]